MARTMLQEAMTTLARVTAKLDVADKRELCDAIDTIRARLPEHVYFDCNIDGGNIVVFNAKEMSRTPISEVH